MASEPLLDVPTLISPISGENPAGQRLPYDISRKLDELRKEVNPDDYDADDPRRPTEVRKPDWKAIIDVAKDTLAGTSKDLLAAARLTEGLTLQYGFRGLRDGLDLLGQLADQCWDRVYPVIEDGDTVEVRAGPFLWLNQKGSGAQFPFQVRSLPLATVAGHPWTVDDWISKDRRPKFEAVLTDLNEELCKTLVEDLTEARDKLRFLNDTLADKMGDLAPDLNSSEGTEHLGAAINECLKVAQQMLQRKVGAAPAGSAGEESSATTVGGGTGGSVSLAQANRADAYRMLNDAAELLQRLEPHSPIPYLVKRAVKLGGLQFPELIKALIRENAVLDELNRLMGIEAPPPEG